MGQAKQRGTLEQRLKQAIEEGREKRPRSEKTRTLSLLERAGIPSWHLGLIAASMSGSPLGKAGKGKVRRAR